MEIECMGKLAEKDIIRVDPCHMKDVQVGSTFKIRIILSNADTGKKGSKEFSPAGKRLFERMHQTKGTGAPSDPKELSHSKLAEDRMEEKFNPRIWIF